MIQDSHDLMVVLLSAYLLYNAGYTRAKENNWKDWLINFFR